MSLKDLVTAAYTAVDIADDTVFSAEMKTTEALGKLRELKEYLDAAPKTAAELVDGCLQYKCTMEYVNFGSPRYIFSRAQLEDFAQTAFAAGLAHRGSLIVGLDTCAQSLGAGYGINPVHDYKVESPIAAQRTTLFDWPSSAKQYMDLVQVCRGPQPSPVPAATPIRTSEAAVDLHFSDGTCVTVRVAGK